VWKESSKHADNNFLHDEQNFVLGMNIVHHLFTGHHEVFRQLLHLKQIPADQSEAWIRLAVSYLTNHGRLEDVLALIGSCATTKDGVSTNMCLERVSTRDLHKQTDYNKNISRLLAKCAIIIVKISRAEW